MLPPVASLPTARRATPWRIQAARRAGRVLLYLTLIAWSFVFAFPFYWLAITSLKDIESIIGEVEWFPEPILFENYVTMWNAHPVGLWIRNSFMITTLGVVAQTLVSLLVAYGFARFRWPGSRFLFFILLGTLIMPGHMLIIPQYVMFTTIGWIDQWWPLMVPNLFGSAFYIFLLRQFIMTLPRELDEAAYTDGANSLGVLFRVLAPNMRPAIATVVVFSFVSHWTDFFGPLIYLNSADKLTLQVGIYFFRGFYGGYGGDYDFPLDTVNLMMAISVLSTVPMVIFFFVAQKQFIRGIVLTGIKA